MVFGLGMTILYTPGSPTSLLLNCCILSWLLQEGMTWHSLREVFALKKATTTKDISSCLLLSPQLIYQMLVCCGDLSLQLISRQSFKEEDTPEKYSQMEVYLIGYFCLWTSLRFSCGSTQVLKLEDIAQITEACTSKMFLKVRAPIVLAPFWNYCMVVSKMEWWSSK